MAIWKDFSSASIGGKLAAIVGFFYIANCIIIAAIPGTILSIIDWNSAVGLYTCASIDLSFGLIMVWAAPSSRSPECLNVLAGMALFGVIFYLLVPVDTWSGIFDWWMIEQLTFTRIACVFVGIPVGVLIMFLAVPSHT